MKKYIACGLILTCLLSTVGCVKENVEYPKTPGMEEGDSYDYDDMICTPYLK